MHFTPQEKVFLLCVCSVVFFGSAVNGICRARPDLARAIELVDSRAFVRRVNVNTASKDDLARVPYIGEGIARKIIEYRTNHGSLRDLNELYAIPGISWEFVKKISLYLKVR